MPQPPLDAIYTADEAAARLRVSKRLIMKRGRELGTCSQIGRDLVFSEDDLLKIWMALRVQPSAPFVERHPTSQPVSWYREDWEGLFSRPSTTVDRRILGILRWLNQQRVPKTYKQIQRAAEPTIKSMLAQGVVDDCGLNDEGLTLVKISEAGKDQLKIAERWARKRTALGKKAVWWGRT